MRFGWIVVGTSVGLAAIVSCSGSDTITEIGDSGSDTSTDASALNDSGVDATVHDSPGPEASGADAMMDSSRPSDSGEDATVDGMGPDDGGAEASTDAPVPNDGGEGDATIDGSDDRGSATDATSDGRSNTDASKSGTTDAGTDALSDSSTDAIPDIEIPDVTFNDGPNEAGLCNNLMNSATPQTVTYVSGPLPVGTGGSVLPGLYFLTAATVFVSDGGVPEGGTTDGGFSKIQETMALDPTATPGTFSVAFIATTSGGADQTENESFTLAGNSVAATLTCGSWSSNGPMTYTFDSSGTPNRLHAFVSNLGGMGIDAEVVFDLQ